MRFQMTEGSRLGSRIYITRPGIYDLGVLRISAPEDTFGAYSLTREAPTDLKARLELFRTALQGTPWEPYLANPEQPPARAGEHVAGLAP